MRVVQLPRYRGPSICRSISSAAANPPRFTSVSLQQAQHRRLLPPKKKGSKHRRGATADPSLRVSAHVLASAHDPIALAAQLRARFGAGAVQVFGGGADGDGSLVLNDVGLIEGVIHLSAPAAGGNAPHGSPSSSSFFFTGPKDADALSSSACVSVWWGAEPIFEDSLLRDLHAAAPRGNAVTRQQQLDRLAIPRAVMRWQAGPRSELGQDGILIDSTCDARTLVLDQLSFSHALQRHMKLLLLEDEMERILSSVKRIVRQGLGPGVSVFSYLPARLGGVDSGARTMQRLLLMREFNFDDSIMSTPDWLWEQPAREAMYDAMVAEYEIIDRIEAINQQLDYAQATMQSLKDDAQHRHSTFLEYTIVVLLGFEVLVEMHALGWINVIPVARGGGHDSGNESSPPAASN
jgi:uncharacterized Rmd1/YagE family protein